MNTYKVNIHAIIVVIIFSLILGGVPYTQASAQAGTITAQWTIHLFDAGDVPFQLEFNPQGGSVTASTTYLFEGYMDAKISFSGTFSGGDGGNIQGTCHPECTLKGAAQGGLGEEFINLACNSCSCGWNGVIYAAGYAEGTSWCDNDGAFFKTMMGEWRVSFDPAAFGGGGQAPQIQPTAALLATEQTLLEPDADEAVLPDGYALYDLQSAIQNEREEAQPGYEGRRTAHILQWNGKLVSVGVDVSGQAFLEDVYGNCVAVDDNGNPLESDRVLDSPSQDVIEKNPHVNWTEALGIYSMQVDWLLESMENPANELLSGTVKDPHINETYLILDELVANPESLEVDELTDKEFLTLQVEGFSLHMQSTMSDLAKDMQYSSQQMLLTAAEEMDNQVEEQTRQAFNTHLQTLAEEQPGVPVEVTSQFYQDVANIVGADRIRELVEQETGLDFAAAQELEEKLRALGVQESELTKTVNAIQALRVLGNLSKPHSVATGGAFSKLFTFVERWASYHAAINALAEDTHANMSKEQLEMVQNCLTELNVFPEGQENFAVTQFVEHVQEMIQEKVKEQMKGE